MKEKIAEIIEHFDSLEEQFSSQDVLGNPDLMKKKDPAQKIRIRYKENKDPL